MFIYLNKDVFLLYSSIFVVFNLIFIADKIIVINMGILNKILRELKFDSELKFDRCMG